MNSGAKKRTVLTPKKEKILEAVLFLIGRHTNLTQYDIVKAIFLADKAHLNKHGRPITYDNYVAMVHGPVPSFTYDLLKPSFNFAHVYGVKAAPWTTVKDGAKNIFVHAKREPNLRVLSKSDQIELEEGLNIVTSMTFGQIKRLTHEEPAYKEAWARRGMADSADISFELLIEDASPDTLEAITHMAKLAS